MRFEILAAIMPVVVAAQQPPTVPALPPSPITRVEVEPAALTIVAGDSMKLRARALDAEGKPVAGARVFYTARGGAYESYVDSAGLVVASSIGTIPIAVTALVPGTRPVIRTVEVRTVPGPADRIAVRDAPARLVAGQTLRLAAVPYSRAGDRARTPVRWTSSAAAVARLDDEGTLIAVAPGRATLTAAADRAAAELAVEVLAADAVAGVEIAPATPIVRRGDVVRFVLRARDAAGRAVDGLTPAWSFAPGDGEMGADGTFVAYRPGEYVVTASLGARTATTVVRVGERDVRRPVTVVGRLPRTGFATSELWIHPGGRVAYLGTHMGGDRVYAIDISDPSRPAVVDSIQSSTRAVNDLLTTADGAFLIFTREGAADRRNGIVIADTRDPLHPKEVARFTEGVTAGVHSLSLYESQKYGRWLYLTNDGTGAIDIVDLSNPARPKRAGTWRTHRPAAGRFVHDLDIVDGLLYASYWNDGLVILDVGNGIRGGTPEYPALVSQYRYDLDSLYRDVERVSASGFTRGTHTAWRQRDGGRYVFIGDEVYRNGDVAGARDASASRMYGTLQVLDVSDIAHPRAVAWYTPEQGGVHNLWVVQDTLYLGAYDGGFHVFDVSGELRGDLRAQGREIASLATADMDGWVRNAAFTWGVVVNPKDGLAYVNDMNNGLWIVRVEARRPERVP